MNSRNLKVFVDSDVVISAVISPNGAAHLLLTKKFPITKIISNYSTKEIIVVAKRLNLSEDKFNKIIKNHDVFKLALPVKKIKEKYNHCVSDPNNSHVVAAAFKSRSQFIVTYNLKHYKTDTIKHNFGILLKTPGQFIQFLRNKR